MRISPSFWRCAREQAAQILADTAAAFSSKGKTTEFCTSVSKACNCLWKGFLFGICPVQSQQAVTL
jgi:hypothetical protein